MLEPLHYRPTNDMMFKKLMTSIGKEHILEDFIHAVTDMKLTKVKPDNPFQIQKYRDHITHMDMELYQTIVDIAATTHEGLDIIIEMQVYSHKGFFERILNYWAAAFTKNHLPNHSRYKPVISIVVTNFQVFKEHDEICVPLGLMHLEKATEIYNKHHQPFERIYLINLKGTDGPNRDLNQWKNFFSNGTIDETEASEALKSAYELLKNTNLTQEERQMAETMSKQEEIYWSTIEYAEEQGRNKVIQSLAKQLPLEQIAELLHMTIEEVQEIVDEQ